MALDFKVQKIQFALFPKGSNLIDKIKKSESDVMDGLKSRTEGLFSGNYNILPIPESAPSEMPRIIISSIDNLSVCSIAISRIDFSRQFIKNESFADVKDKFIKDIRNIFPYFSEEPGLNLRIGRIGFVVDFIINDTEEESRTKLKKIFQDEYYPNKTSHLKDMTVVFTEADTIDSGGRILEIVKLIKIDTITEEDNKISLRYDINTDRKEIGNYNLISQDVEELLKKALQEIEEETLEKFIKVRSSE